MATQQTTQETIVEHITRDRRRTDMAIAELEMRLRKQGDDELTPVFAPMKRELLGHIAAEEQLLYPHLERGETRDLVPDARKGHAAIRRRLEELAAGGAMDKSEWGRRLQVLKQEVQHHATDGEGEFLPAARRVLDEQQLSDLGSRFERMQSEWARRRVSTAAGRQILDGRGYEERRSRCEKDGGGSVTEKSS